MRELLGRFQSWLIALDRIRALVDGVNTVLFNIDTDHFESDIGYCGSNRKTYVTQPYDTNQCLCC